MSAKEMRKLLCEFINSILTDLDAGEENERNVQNWMEIDWIHRILIWTGSTVFNFRRILILVLINWSAL